MPNTPMLSKLPVADLAARRGFTLRRLAVGAAVSLIAAGCRSTGAGTGGATGSALPPLRSEGVVARVNADHGFALVDCYVLPRAGEEMVVWREGRRVAMVRALERRRIPYVAVDILAGQPRRGDFVRGERWEPKVTEENGP